MMDKLAAWSKRHPYFAGCLALSAGAHFVAFLFLIVNFAWPHKLDEQVESVPVEMVTDSDFNQIMNGEKTAKQMPTPQRRVDQVAELEDKKSEPPIPDSKKDTPPPPSPEKATNDPGQDDKPPEVANAPPPPPTPVTRPQPVAPAPPPVPTPPERPVEKSEAPPPKADTVKPPPEDAEALEPKPQPQPRPKIEAKKPPKKVAKLPPKKPPVRPVQEAKEVPDPPRKPDTPPEPSLKERTLDQVAKLLDSMKPPKPAVKPKSGNEAREAKHSDFSVDKISALLDHDAPQRTASKGRQLTQLASLGSPTAHADRMTPTLKAQIDGWLIDHYRGCWSYFGLGATSDYVPKVHVQMAPDGTLSARPVLINQPDDPNLRSLADSALRAVTKCNPMPIPSWFKGHYEAWRDQTVKFDPKEMS